ncbi:MAG: Gldg family protein [Akkermansiaceae bacterium]
MKALKPFLAGIAGIGVLLFVLGFLVESLESVKWTALILGLAALSFVPDGRVMRAAFGTVVLAALIFFVTQLIGETGLGRKNIDLTEDDRYTLTEGTKAILAELEDPVVINYYVNRDLRSTPADIKQYIPRVDNLLEEFEGLAKDGNITVNFIDPKPNTDEEDAAALDQIQQFPVSQEENLFFGASITCWDQKTVLPFFNPQTETQLEFDLISAIAEVSSRNKPTVGLVTPLPVASGGQTGQGWVFSQFLRRAYNLADLGMGVTDRLASVYESNEWGEAPDHLDPEKIPVVLVIHPAAITPEAEYALDQYLLRGGTVIACLDAYSINAAQSSPQPQFPGMPPQGGGIAPQSTLPKLLEHLKITFSGDQILADNKFGVRQNPTIINLGEEAMPVEDSIALASIDQLLFGYAGAFDKVNTTGLDISRLIRSSRQSDLVDASLATNNAAAAQLSRKLRYEDRRYDLLVYLSGDFTTAFPDGDPSQEQKDDDQDEEESENATEEKKPAEESGLKEASAKGHLYLFADSDFLSDGAAYRLIPMGGQRGGGIPQQLSDNGPLVFNLLDQATNSKHLIGARARTPNWRPFTVFQEMKAEAEEKTGEKIEEIEKSQKSWNDEITKIMQKRGNRGEVFLSESEQQRLEELNQQVVDSKKEIRELEKENQSEVDAIKSGVFWRSIVTVPIIVILFGLGVFLFRSFSTQAR